MKTEMKYLLNKDGKHVGYEYRRGGKICYSRKLDGSWRDPFIPHDSWLPVIELSGEWYRDGEEVELFCGTRGKLKYQALWYGWDVYLPTWPQPLSDFYDIASGKWRIRKVKP